MKILKINWQTRDYDYVVKAPGIPYHNDIIKEFISRKIKVYTDLELGMRLRNKYYIVVSGSNGKTTTTYLITNMLNTQFSAISCGNCGFPISQAALDYRHYKYYVIELSSFQLKGIKKFTPKIAVVTNVKQAHLDYHKSIEDYYKSKINITKNQTKEDYLVLNIDDPTSVLLFKNSEATKITYSLNNKNSTCYYNKGNFYYNKEIVCNIRHLNNKTDIFKYDVMASICVAKLLNVENKNIINALKKFENIKYRLESLGKNIYNDAKSTNIYSTISALNEFKNKEVFLICGGYDRKDDLSGLDSNISNVIKVYTYGATKERVYNYFKKKKIEVIMFETLRDATLKALNDRIDEVILYSPMFASYDQYASYEERGREFNNLINSYYEK